MIHHLKHSRGHLWTQPQGTPVCRARTIEKPTARDGAGPGDEESRAAWLPRGYHSPPGPPPKTCGWEAPTKVQKAHLALVGQTTPSAVSGRGDAAMFSVAAGIGG